MKQIPLWILSSLCYYFAFKQEITLFEVLSWIQLFFAFVILILGAVIINAKNNIVKEVDDVTKDNGIAYWLFSAIFFALNVWITWNTNFCYAYVFISLCSMYFILEFKAKKKKLEIKD